MSVWFRARADVSHTRHSYFSDKCSGKKVFHARNISIQRSIDLIVSVSVLVSVLS